VGYSSETAFSQAFKRQYGVSPSQYRKDKNADQVPKNQV
jgi:AraC-like DNA-binding protein